MSQEKKRNSTFSNTIKTLFFGAKASDQLSVMEEEQMLSPMKTIVRNFFQNKLAIFGLITFTFMFLSCFIIPIFKPLDVTFSDFTQSNVAPGFDMMNIPTALKNDMKSISGGATYGAGVTNSGDVYIYGKVPDTKMYNVPDDMGNIIDISAGYNHLLALNSDGEVFAWGYDRLGVTSIPTDDIKRLSGDIAKIDAGYQISYILTDEGYAAYWGNENLMEIRGFSDVQGNIAQMEFNTSTGMVLTENQEVVVLANSELPIKSVPSEIQGKVIDVALSERTAAAITEDGKMHVWGDISHSTLKTVEQLDNLTFVTVEGGRNHFTALTTDGKVVSWGDDEFGQASVPANISKLDNIVSIETDFHQNYAIDSSGNIHTWGLKGYLMGTDNYGRDVFTRLVSGGRMTMTVGGIAVIISSIIGIIVGGIAGYYGGTRIDDILMRFAEIVSGLPFLPLAMILSSLIGNSISETGRIMLIMVIMGLLGWTGLARITRAQILAEREKEFVTAAKAMGVQEKYIVFKHIVPNVVTTIIVSITLSFAGSMLTESGLSYLGFGVAEPNPTWGNMLSNAQDSKVIVSYWWQWIFPAIALSLATISINSVGDGLRDAIDPHSNDR